MTTDLRPNLFDRNGEPTDSLAKAVLFIVKCSGCSFRWYECTNQVGPFVCRNCRGRRVVALRV